MILVNHMLGGDMREYIIQKVKKPLIKALIVLANRYPEPTRDNVIHPNTLKLLDFQDKFFEYEDNPGREELFRAVFRVLIAEYEHDPYYHYRFDWLLEEIAKSDWQPRNTMLPQRSWLEPVTPPDDKMKEAQAAVMGWTEGK